MPPSSNDDAADVPGRLPPELRAELDELILQQRHIQALKLLREHVGTSLREATELFWRYDQWLEDHWPVLAKERAEAADPQRWKEQALAKLEALERAPVALEAHWDGDEFWWLCLFAVLPGASREHPRFTRVPLGVFGRRGREVRLSDGSAPSWPESVVAKEVAAWAQASWGVPFHFPSPDTPDFDDSAWWDTAP